MNPERYLKHLNCLGPFAKPLALKSKEHLEFVRNLPCIVTGKNPSEPHHVITKKTANNDYLCIPLCHEKHRELHDIGRERFERKYGIDLTDAVLAVLIKKANT